MMTPPHSQGRKNPLQWLAAVDWRQPAVTDAIVIIVLALCGVVASWYFDIFEGVAKFQNIYGDWGLDDLIMASVFASFGLCIYAWRRFKEFKQEAGSRLAAEAEVREKVDEITRAWDFLQSIVEHVPAAILVRKLPERRFVLVNREAQRLLRLSRDVMLEHTPAEIFPEATANRIYEHDETMLQAAEPVSFGEEVAIGGRITVSTACAIRGKNGNPLYLLNVVEDVTERRQAEARIAHLAHHDPLTDLPNRAAFNQHVDGAIEQAATEGEAVAIMCIDLDRFKEVNDVFGHALGDGLLCEVAKRMLAAAEGAFVARLGGDEFSVICAGGPQPGTAETLADRILQAVSGDIEIGGHTLRAGMSVGIAVYPADGADKSVLLANADAALYRAKAEARGTIRFFAPDMDKRLRERRALQHDLRSAIAHNELLLHYQPQAAVGGGITGFEALVRWNHPKRGTIPPGEFIPLAEESGLIVQLGEWILRAACHEAATWPTSLRIAVNFSPVQFRHGDLPSLVHSVLLESGLSAERLEIEITEGVLIDDFSRGLSILRRLKALGVRIAMDDFGTGYSSLSYLQSFPFDKIKIDRAFVANVERNPQSAAIVRAVIGLGRGLKIPIVAEGVETNEQLKFLEQEACGEIQGYLIGRPAPIERYSEIVGHKIGARQAEAVRALAS
jgi:diguanylate cyclase (GGDEF)-like protein/PAS domain S-box-containing protein